MKDFIMVTDKTGQAIVVRSESIMLIEPCLDDHNLDGCEITLTNGTVLVVKDKLMDLLLNLASI